MSTYLLDSTQTPALDGCVLDDGTFAPAGVLTMAKSAAGSGRMWLLFPDAAVGKYHRVASAVLRLTAAANSPALKLRARVACAESVLPPASAAELAALPLTEGVDVLLSAASAGGMLQAAIGPAINQYLEALPPTGRARPLMLVLDFADDAANGTGQYRSGEDADNKPSLEIAEESVLNVWRGDAPTAATSFRVRVLPPVVAGTEYRIVAEHDRLVEASYVAVPGDTPASVAAALAAVLDTADQDTVDYTDGQDNFVYTSPLVGAETVYEASAASSQVERVQAGALVVTQIVDVYLETATTGGTWQLVCDWGGGAETTAGIACDATAGDVKSALEVLPTPQAGDVLVSKIGQFRWRIEFAGTLAGTNATVTLDHSALIFTRARLSRLQDADPNGDVTHLYTVTAWPGGFQQGQSPSTHGKPDRGVVTIGHPGDPTYPQDVRWRIRFGTGSYSSVATITNNPIFDGTGNDGHPRASLTDLGFEGTWADVILRQLAQLLSAAELAQVVVAGDKGFVLTGDAYSGDKAVPPVVLISIPQSVKDARGAFKIQIGGGSTWHTETTVSPMRQTTKPVWFFSTLNYSGAHPPAGFLSSYNQFLDNFIYKLSGRIGTALTGYTVWDAGRLGDPAQLHPTEHYVPLNLPKYDLASENWVEPDFYSDKVDIGLDSESVSLHLKQQEVPVTQPLFNVFSLRESDTTRHGSFVDWDGSSAGGSIYQDDPVIQLFGGSARWLIEWGGTQTPPGQDLILHPQPVFPNTTAGHRDPAGTGYHALVVRLGHFVGAQNQIDRLELIANGGTFTLTAEGDTTAPISYPPTPASIDSAMAAAAGSDVLDVRSDGVTFDLEWVGAYAEQAVAVSVNGSALTGMGGQVVPIRDGSPSLNEIQRIVVDPTAFDGTLQFGDPLTGEMSPAFSWNADVSDLQDAADALMGAGESLWTRADDGGPWVVEFTGTHGGRPLPLMRLRQRLRVTGAGMEVSELSAGGGPNHWAIAGNWSLGRIPHSGDVVVFADGGSEVLYGLVQRAECRARVGYPEFAVSGTADFRNGQRVRLSTTGTLPAPLGVGRDYLITDWSRLYRQLRLIDAVTGAVIVPTDEGNGTHEIVVRLQQLHARMAYRGGMGLPRRRQDGTVEGRPRFLRIGFLGNHEQDLLLGLGSGAGFSRFLVDSGRDGLAVLALSSGQGRGEQEAVQLLSEGGVVLENHGASVAIAATPGETSRIVRLRLFGGTTRLGRQVVAVEGAEIVRHSRAVLICEDCELQGAVIGLLE